MSFVHCSTVSRELSDPTARPLPSVCIVLVTFNGREHLAPCLDSIAALDYSKDRVRTVCVDNDSTDGTKELLAASYPWVTVLAQKSNLGFAPAVTLAAEFSSEECVALINNDMRVDPQWLRALASRFRPDQGVVCVAGTILNWDGTKVDFADSTINFHGFGQQQGFGMAIEEAVATGLLCRLPAVDRCLLSVRSLSLSVALTRHSLPTSKTSTLVGGFRSAAIAQN